MLSYQQEFEQRDKRIKRQIDIHPDLLVVLDEWVRLRNIGRKGIRGVTNYNRSDAFAFGLFFGLDELRKNVREMVSAETKRKAAEQKHLETEAQ